MVVPSERTTGVRAAIGIPNVGEYGDPRLLVSLAIDAEDAGWDGVFLWDHVLYRDREWPVADPWTALSAIAAETDRVRVGILVAGLARRRPWKVARETATLDTLSNGRLVVGAGLGSLDDEYDAFGEDPDPYVRARRLDEALEIVTGLWRGEPFSFTSSDFRVDDVTMRPTPVQRPRVPVWIGGRWPNRRPFERAARWDGVVPTHRDHAKGETMPPEELAAVVRFVGDRRGSLEGYDVALEGCTDGSRHAEAADTVAAYAAAGLTWWIEALGWWRGSVADMRTRVRDGPPPLPSR